MANSDNERAPPDQSLQMSWGTVKAIAPNREFEIKVQASQGPAAQRSLAEPVARESVTAT